MADFSENGCRKRLQDKTAGGSGCSEFRVVPFSNRCEVPLPRSLEEADHPCKRAISTTTTTPSICADISPETATAAAGRAGLSRGIGAFEDEMRVAKVRDWQLTPTRMAFAGARCWSD
jgi:hypothetical protein